MLLALAVWASVAGLSLPSSAGCGIQYFDGMLVVVIFLPSLFLTGCVPEENSFVVTSLYLAAFVTLGIKLTAGMPASESFR